MSYERVLHIITVPLTMDGITLFPLRLSGAFKQFRSDYLSFQISAPAVAEAIESLHGKLYIVPHRLKKPLKYIRAVSHIVRINGYTIVHCHGNSSTLLLDLIAAKLGGARIRIAHSHNTRTSYPLLHRFLWPCFSLTYTHALACSEAAGHWLFHQKTFQVIPNGIDIERFSYRSDIRIQTRHSLLLESKRLIGSIAAFVPAKNHSFLLHCFEVAHRCRPELHLLLIGGGPLEEQIREMIHSLALDSYVTMLGLREDIPDLLCALDALVLPSLHEGLPTVVLEAQGSGLPVLMSEAVTPSCSLTSFTRRIPLEETCWIEALEHIQDSDRSAQSAEGRAVLIENGFDISSSAQLLENLYRVALRDRFKKARDESHTTKP